MKVKEFYKNKNVFITGHTGFKGSWLSLWLDYLGANVTGFSDETKSDEDVYNLSRISRRIVDERGDITERKHLKLALQEAQPEIVFHLAAQPLVRYAYENPYITYLTNVIGTLNVLDAVRSCNGVKAVIIVTTDKCYKNNEWVWGYRENDELGGYDPYSSSKACCEILVDSYRQSFFNYGAGNVPKIGVATVWAGNVIGGGDWAKDRIVPDCIRSIQAGRPIQIRNPHAVRPWQHVLEPLGGYLLLAMKLYAAPKKYSEAFNFGPGAESIVEVNTIVKKITQYYGEGSWARAENLQAVHEAKLLSLNISKSLNKLGWKPVWNIDEALQKTVYWYKYYQNTNVHDLCVEQIDEYQKLISW